MMRQKEETLFNKINTISFEVWLDNLIAAAETLHSAQSDQDKRAAIREFQIAATAYREFKALLFELAEKFPIYVESEREERERRGRGLSQASA